jgi:aspartate kinase
VIDHGSLEDDKLSGRITVLKFGGTSLADGPAFDRAAQIVRASEGTGLVVIGSAMSGVTDTLITSFRRAARLQTTRSFPSLEECFERHLLVAGNLSAIALAKMQGLVEEARREIFELLGSAATDGMARLRTQDAIASYGEQLSARLLAMTLEQHGILASYVDARRCILTNDHHGSASPLLEEVTRRTRAQLKPLLEKKQIPVLGGFFGATLEGATTTLGRGSSDYTATLVGAALGACEIQIWSDVDGVQTADPALVKATRTVPQISYGEAAQLARLGARVIHPKMIEPVIAQEIPIQIRNSRAPEKGGTVIRARSEPGKGAIKAIAHRTNLTRIDVTAAPAFVANGFLAAIGEVFARHQGHTDLVARSKVCLTFAYDEDERLLSIVEDLKLLGSVDIERHRAIVGCVGDGLQKGAGNGTTIGGLLRAVDPLLDWQRTSSNSLSAIVDGERVESLVSLLHLGVFESDWARQEVPSVEVDRY